MTPLPGEVELDLVRKLGKGPGPFDLADDLKVLVYPFEVEGHLHGTSWSPCQYPVDLQSGREKRSRKRATGPRLGDGAPSREGAPPWGGLGGYPITPRVL